MEFVCIEAKTFEDMRMALELLKKKVEMLSQRHLPKRLNKWLDNQEVCAILHISPRTLQSLRSNGTLSYTQIDRRTYYQEHDIMRLLGMTGCRRKSRKESEG